MLHYLYTELIVCMYCMLTSTCQWTLLVYMNMRIPLMLDHFLQSTCSFPYTLIFHQIKRIIGHKRVNDIDYHQVEWKDCSGLTWKPSKNIRGSIHLNMWRQKQVTSTTLLQSNNLNFMDVLIFR
jgi:hypothetical protein